jgi:hypothetical protein
MVVPTGFEVRSPDAGRKEELDVFGVGVVFDGVT